VGHGLCLHCSHNSEPDMGSTKAYRGRGEAEGQQRGGRDEEVDFSVAREVQSGVGAPRAENLSLSAPGSLAFCALRKLLGICIAPTLSREQNDQALPCPA
jgi:hypothetical protein